MDVGIKYETRGEGIYVWDSEGHQILDAMSGLWCVNVGYGRKALADAARRGVWVQRVNEDHPRDLSILGSTQAFGLSADGRNLLLLESPAIRNPDTRTTP